MSGLQSKITSAVTAKGYQVVSNPDTAGYWIQANVLKADKMDLRETQGWLSRGYEGAATAAHWVQGSPPITPVQQARLSVSAWQQVWSVWRLTRWWKT
jgi:hypothetical protein